MLRFLNNLLNGKEDLSSKRFISLYSLILLTGFVVVSICGIEVQEYQFWGLVGLVGGSQGMTFIQKYDGLKRG